MNISPIYSSYNRNYPVTVNKKPVAFEANPNSQKLRFAYNDFFVFMKGYGHDTVWADKVKTIADEAVEKIKTSSSSDEVLPYIASGIKKANKLCYGNWNSWKRQHSGILRTSRNCYGRAGEWNGKCITTPVVNQYESYEQRLFPLIKYPLKKPYKDMSMTTVGYYDNEGRVIQLIHGDDDKINNVLDKVNKHFGKLKEDFISKPENVTESTLPKINENIAEIRWLMAHSMPWERGSDSISNIFMRALYKSMGVKTYPLKKGLSLDMEAFCTPLNEYKQKFHTYFENEPKVV